MSEGHILEGTPIAVNWWKPHGCQNLPTELFFLTQVHPDTIKELSITWNKPIFTSCFAAELLKTEKPFLSRLIHPLPFDNRNQLSLKSGDSVFVTLVNSSSPGSVGYIFEGPFGKILYTGNFRFHKDMFQTINIPEIGSLYFDNTYCSENCKFPKQSEMVPIILNFIREHLGKERIILACDSIGKEELLHMIYKETKCRIKVTTERMRTLKFYDLGNIACTNVPVEKERLILVDIGQVSKLTIKKWSFEMPTEILLLTSKYVGSKNKPFRKYFNVSVCPYSSHSSFNELIEFVKLIRPKKLLPIIVKPIKGMFDLNQGSLSSLNILMDHIKQDIDDTKEKWVLTCVPCHLENTEDIINLLNSLSSIHETSEKSKSVPNKNIPQVHVQKTYTANKKVATCNKELSKKRPNISQEKCKSKIRQNINVHPNSSRNIKSLNSLYSNSSELKSCETALKLNSQNAIAGQIQQPLQQTNSLNGSQHIAMTGISDKLGTIVSSGIDSLNDHPTPLTCVLFGTMGKSSKTLDINSSNINFQATTNSSNPRLSQPLQQGSYTQIESDSTFINSYCSNQSPRYTSSNNNSYPRALTNEKACTNLVPIRPEVPTVFLDIIQKCQRKQEKKCNKSLAVDITYHSKNGVIKKYQLKESPIKHS